MYVLDQEWLILWKIQWKSTDAILCKTWIYILGKENTTGYDLFDGLLVWLRDNQDPERFEIWELFGFNVAGFETLKCIMKAKCLSCCG